MLLSLSSFPPSTLVPKSMSSQIPPIPSFFPLASFLEPRLRVGGQQLSKKRQLSLLKDGKAKYSSKKLKKIEYDEEESENGDDEREFCGEENSEYNSEDDLAISTSSDKHLSSDTKTTKHFHGYYKKEVYSIDASYFNVVFQLRIQTKIGIRLEYIPVALPFMISSSTMKSMTMDYPDFCCQDMQCFNHIFPKAKLMVMDWDKDSCSIDLSNVLHLLKNSSFSANALETGVQDPPQDPNQHDVEVNDTKIKEKEENSNSSDDESSDDDEWKRLFLDSSDDEIDNIFKQKRKNIPLFKNDETTTITTSHESRIQIQDASEDAVVVGLFMTDKTPDDIVSIKIEIFPPVNLILPHAKKQVCIQNACGSCTAPYQLNLSCFKHLSKKKKSFSACESLSTVTATFVLCSNRCRVDFRGVRSLEAMSHDWKLVSGLEIDEVFTSIYLLVMKGCIGSSLLLTSETCFLANATASWCRSCLHFDDLCDIIELCDINWDKIFPHESVSDATKRAKVQVNISRRGGAVIRMVYPKNSPWSISSEKDVLSDCNRLLDLLSNILSGKMLDLS